MPQELMGISRGRKKEAMIANANPILSFKH